MARNTNQERVLPEMAKFGGTVLKTNPDGEQQQHLKGRYPRPLPHSVRRRLSRSARYDHQDDAVHAAILIRGQRLPNEEKGTMSWREDLRPPAVWEHFYQLTMCECVFMSVPDPGLRSLARSGAVPVRRNSLTRILHSSLSTTTWCLPR